MFRTSQRRDSLFGRHARTCALTAVLCGLSSPALAQSDNWEVDIAPLYLWASELDGRVAVADRSVPIFMDFGDAVDKLAGAFSVHVEARKNRWGILGDVSFVRLSTDATFTTPILSRPVDGNAQLDMTIVEAGGSYLVKPDANLNVIGGFRTYTLSPTLEFEGAAGELTPVDTSRTAVGFFGGLTYRPKLSDKWVLLTRADLGGGEAFTWSGTLGFEYRFKPWGGVMVGYRALGIDTGDADEGTNDLEYEVTHYGPIFSLTLHWTQK
jgi:hypothetical protein